MHSVTEEEEPVAAIISEGVAAFETNMVGPLKYLRTYDDYLYIINGQANKSLDEFFAIEPFPFLRDFAKRIEKYEGIKKDIIFVRRSIPLNFISLECGDFNDTMYEIIDNLRMRIVNYYIDKSHQHNRE